MGQTNEFAARLLIVNRLLGIDQGTTGSTDLLIGHDLPVHGRYTIDFPQHFSKPGWVEHDPEVIWASLRQAILENGGQTSPRPIYYVTN